MKLDVLVFLCLAYFPQPNDFQTNPCSIVVRIPFLLEAENCVDRPYPVPLLVGMLVLLPSSYWEYAAMSPGAQHLFQCPL